MINIELENEIINYISKQYRPRWISLNDKWKEYLLQRFDDCNNIKESYLRLKFNIAEIPKCPICGKPVKFHGDNYVYDKTCGEKKCQSELRNKKSIETKIKKYGNPNYNNIDKCKQTKLKKYGNPNYNNIKQAISNTDYTKRQEKIRKTCLERYGVLNGGCSEQALKKIKTTFIKKYGVEYSWNIPGVLEKSKLTKLNKYGDQNYTNREKSKQTCLKRYGVNNVFKSKEIQNKYKETCLRNWGVDHNWKIKDEHKLTYTPEAIQKKKLTSLKNWGTEHPQQSIVIKQKVFNTKQKNHTFNTSKPEIESYKLLKEKYPDVIYQYKDKERYPFICDFYIPSLDLFIECNYHWTHGGHPYDDTNENDIQLLNKWKNKNTKYYLGAIYTWTIRDIQKRNIVKQNNLNYKEFYNVNDLKKWLTF